MKFEFDSHLILMMCINSMEEADFLKYSTFESLKSIEDELGLDHYYSEELYNNGGFDGRDLKLCALGVMENADCYGPMNLNNLDGASNEQVLNILVTQAIKDHNLINNYNNSDYVTCMFIYLFGLMAYAWFRDTHIINNINNNLREELNNMNDFVFNYNNYQLVEGRRGTDPNSYKYLGEDFSHYPKYLSGDDYILNSLLDLCIESLQEDEDWFYINTHADGVRASNITKTWRFNKYNGVCQYINKYPSGATDPIRIASLSAAGGKDGVAGRPYYFISIVIGGKTRQIGLHKVLGVLANAPELIKLRNKLKCPLCGLVPNHLNNCGTENTVGNLEMVTNTENLLHSRCVDIISNNKPEWLVDKDHTPEVWVRTKNSWVIPNRNILRFKLSIQDIYNYLDAEGIVLGNRPIRDVINPVRFIAYLEKLWKEA